MNEEEVKGLLEEACARLYAEQLELVATRTNERTIQAYLVGYLQPLFAEWEVDPEYNREGRAGERKRDEEGLLVPDIIIHTRGERLGPNLAAIEIKGYWNVQDRRMDEDKLRRIAVEYG